MKRRTSSEERLILTAVTPPARNGGRRPGAGRPLGSRNKGPRKEPVRTGRSIKSTLRAWASADAAKADIEAIAAAISLPGVPEAEIAARLTAFLRKHRIPEGSPPELAALAGLALARICSVLLGQVGFRKAPTVLKAATAIREELCGSIPKSMSIDGSLAFSFSAAVRQAQREAAAQEAAAQRQLPAPVSSATQAPPEHVRDSDSQPSTLAHEE